MDRTPRPPAHPGVLPCPGRRFTFALGADDLEAGPGSFIRVPPATRHELRAAPGGGRLLTMWVPGGTEAMFVELSQLPPAASTTPSRKAISERFDSIPT